VTHQPENTMYFQHFCSKIQYNFWIYTFKIQTLLELPHLPNYIIRFSLSPPLKKKGLFYIHKLRKSIKIKLIQRFWKKKSDIWQLWHISKAAHL